MVYCIVCEAQNVILITYPGLCLRRFDAQLGCEYTTCLEMLGGATGMVETHNRALKVRGIHPGSLT